MFSHFSNNKIILIFIYWICIFVNTSDLISCNTTFAFDEKISTPDLKTFNILKFNANLSSSDSVVYYYKIIIQLCKNKKYFRFLTTTYCDLATKLSNFDKFSDSKLFLDSAEFIIKKENFNDLYGYYYIKKGNLYRNINTDTALYYFNIANSLKDSLNSDLNEILMHNLMLLHFKANNFKQAQEYGLAALIENKNSINKNKISTEISLYNNLYLTENALKDSLKATFYLFQANKLVQDSLNGIGNLFVYQNMGKYYLKQNTDSALHYFEKFQEIVKRDYATDYQFYPNLYFAETYLQRKNLVKCEYYLSKANDTLNPDSLQDLPAQREYYQVLYNLNLLNKNNTKALFALQKYKVYSDSIFTSNNIDQILNYEKQIKEIENDKKIALSQEKYAKQKSYTTLIAAILLMTLISASFAVLYWRKKQKQIEQDVILQAQQADLDKSFALIQANTEERKRIAQELHDNMGSTITSIIIASKILKSDAMGDKVDNPIIKTINKNAELLITQLKEVIWSLNEENNSIESFSNYIAYFVEVFLNTAKISYNFIEKIEHKNYLLKNNERKLLYLSIKEIVNNIVKYANASLVEISIIETNFFLNITISDNGVGFSDIDKINSGNGIKNIKNNLNKINGEASWKNINGTKVNLVIKLNF